ncbi:MAG: MBL fold metallo-hydrolase [Deltaproteobacteria bacterium]|nr:MBL fold metallo-hydrolase [Deltaproteobacteria bacterium]
MFIKIFSLGMFQSNCIIVADQDQGKAVIIDPGDEADKILSEIQRHKFTVTHILLTHAHHDHIGAVSEIQETLGCSVCLHTDDLFLYDNIAMQASFLGAHLPKIKMPKTLPLKDNDVIECTQDLTVKVLHTPGHSPGSVCFVIHNHLISGDTLFMGSIGRTDLWNGNYDSLINAVRTKLFTLPLNTIVLPGHGPHTTIKNEINHNPFFQD